MDMPIMTPEDLARYVEMREHLVQLSFLASHHLQLSHGYHTAGVELLAEQQALLDKYTKAPARKFGVIEGGKRQSIR